MESSASTETHSDASDKGMVLEVMSPRRGKTKKAKKHSTQSQLSIGRKSNKLIITMPTGGELDSSSPQHVSSKSPARKDTKQKENRSPTPILIDSDESVPTTRSGKKRKSVQEEGSKKKQKTGSSSSKKTNSTSKNGRGKGNIKKTDEESVTSGDNANLTFEEFLRDKDVKKWRYLIDLISDEDIEAIQICIDERGRAEEEKEEKDIAKQQKKALKEFNDGKINIKTERQTDGSCDRTETECSTDSSVQKKTCHKKLLKEFFVYTYVGSQKKRLKLVEMDSTDMDNTDGSSSEGHFQFSHSDMDNYNTSDACGSDVDMEGNMTANETDQEIKEVPDSGVETETSIVEVDIRKSPVVYHSVDTDSETAIGKNNSTSTDKIFSGFQSGERMSLDSVSECNVEISPETIELSSDGANSAKAQVTETDENKEDAKAEESKEKVAIVTEETDKQHKSTDTLKTDEKKEDAKAEESKEKVAIVTEETDKQHKSTDTLKTDEKKEDAKAEESKEKVEIVTEETDKQDKSTDTLTVSHNKMEQIDNDAASTDPAEEEENILVCENVNPPVADLPKTGDAPESDVKTVPMSEVPTPVHEIAQETSVADILTVPMSAAEVPTPVNEITQDTSVADIPTVPTSAAEVPAPVKEITQETSVADVPNLTDFRSMSTFTITSEILRQDYC